MTTQPNDVELYKVLHLLKIAFAHISRDRTPEQLGQMMDLYCDLLRDLPVAEVKAAALQLIASSKWYPTVAEIRDQVHKFHIVALDVPSWEGAWNEVLGEVRRVGYGAWQDTRWSAESVKDTARTFWRDACLCDMEQLSFVRSQFRDVYNAKVRRADDERARLPIVNQMIQGLAGSLRLGAGRDTLTVKDTFLIDGRLPFDEVIHVR